MTKLDATFDTQDLVPNPDAIRDQTTATAAFEPKPRTPPRLHASNFQLAQIGDEVILVGSGIRGTPVPNKEEMIIQNEPIFQVVLSISAAKALAQILSKCVDDYETHVGEIPTLQSTKRTRIGTGA